MSQVKSNNTGPNIEKYGYCYMCHDSCQLKTHVRQGKAVGIDMLNAAVRDTCPRWKAQLAFAYHQDRLRHPLKRIGTRGEGSFEQIS